MHYDSLLKNERFYGNLHHFLNKDTEWMNIYDGSKSYGTKCSFL